MMYRRDQERLVNSIVGVFTDHDSFVNTRPWEVADDRMRIDCELKQFTYDHEDPRIACLQHKGVRAEDGEWIYPVTMIDSRERDRDSARRMIRTFFVHRFRVVTDIGGRDLVHQTPGSLLHVGFWEHNENLSEGGDDIDYLYFDGSNVETEDMVEALTYYAKNVAHKAEYIARSIAAAQRGTSGAFVREDGEE